MGEPSVSRKPSPILPVVTTETVEGIIGAISESGTFFRGADDALHDEQTGLHEAITEWASRRYGPDGVGIAKRTAVIMYLALHQQAASDSLRREHPVA